MDQVFRPRMYNTKDQISLNLPREYETFSRQVPGYVKKTELPITGAPANYTPRRGSTDRPIGYKPSRGLPGSELSNKFVDAVNSMGSDRLNEVVDSSVSDFLSRQKPGYTARNYNATPGSISVAPGSAVSNEYSPNAGPWRPWSGPWDLARSSGDSDMSRFQGGSMPLYPRETEKQSQYRNTQAQSNGGLRPPVYNQSTAPKTPPRTLEYNSNDQQIQANAGGSMPLNGGQLPSVASSGVGAGMLGASSQLQNAPGGVSSPSQWSANGVSSGQVPSVPGSATGGAYVRPPYAPHLFANSPVPRAGLPQSVPFRQETPEDALAGFNSEARRLAAQPRENLYGMTSGIITDALAREKQKTAEDVKRMVDDRLAGRQGYYATPQQRQSGFFARGMGPMAGDAAIMERQNRPLGDGGPAAAAARADQESLRLEAEEAMGGLAKDGLTRYVPNKDLLSFANALRSQEDRQKSEMLQKAGLGDGASLRDPMKAMTPDEIRFYRHKLNMATNPAYANRVNQQRADRQEMLDNRREMVRARRAGALEAAGASQQMRNLMAGRGALAGQDGFNALMGLAAMQNANQAFDNYGQAYMANMAPQMLDQRLDAEGDLLGKRADLERMRQFDQLRMDIMTSGRPEIEKQRALKSLNDLVMSSGTLGGSGGGVATGAQDGTSVAIPSWVQPPTIDPNDTRPTRDRAIEWLNTFHAHPNYSSLPEDQRAAIEKEIIGQYFGGIPSSEILQYQQNNDPNWFNRNIFYPILEFFGTDDASQRAREERAGAFDSISPRQKPPQLPARRPMTVPGQLQPQSPATNPYNNLPGNL